MDVERMDLRRTRECVDRSRDQYGHCLSSSEVAWPNGKASDYESEDSGFDPQRDQSFCLSASSLFLFLRTGRSYYFTSIYLFRYL